MTSCTLSSKPRKRSGTPTKTKLLSVILEASGQAFQQPCPKRVELLDARYVDDDAVCGLLRSETASTSCSKALE